jgi:very-short-patch-repair endonuclease
MPIARQSVGGTGINSFYFLDHKKTIKVRATMSVRQARRFRKKSTRAEKRLWSRLRDRKAAGLKFRRQHCVGDRVVDFFCAEAKLAIELDGSGHSRHFGEASDLDRELELYEKGIRILRFHNQGIFENLDGVLNRIIYAVDPEKSLWSHV